MASVTNKGPREDRWYFSIMAPNTKGEKFAWLDPTSIYINGDAFSDLLDDLCADIDATEVDVVGSLDAMGFVLGAALASRLGVGFSPYPQSRQALCRYRQSELLKLLGPHSGYGDAHTSVRSGHARIAG